MEGNISQVNDTITGNISSENETLTGNVVMPIGVTPDISVGTTETLQPNESAYVELDETSTRLNPIFNFGIPKGDKGDTGATGADGYSPTANVSKVDDTATITITDKTGTTTATITDGTDGEDGADGYSPTATVSKSGKVATITITDKNGTTTTTIRDGEDGQGSGDMLKATYDTNDNGIVDNAEKVNNHTVESDVPLNAVFTDTTYTAGTGIDITGNVISNTQTSAEWGNITGTLSNQTDLNTALSGKQATLVSGTNIKTINSTSLLGSGNISIPDEVTISNSEPTDPDNKLWIDTGEVGSLGSEIESGSNTNGNYVKFADGTMICYKTVSGSTTCNTALGSLYQSPEITSGLYPVEFISEPVVTLSPVKATGSGYQYFIMTGENGPTSLLTNAPNFVLLRATTRSSLSYKISVIAIGRWK